MIEIDRYSQGSIQNTLSALSGLVVYSHVKDDPILRELKILLMEMSKSLLGTDVVSDSSVKNAPAALSLYAWTDRYTRIYTQLMNNNL